VTGDHSANYQPPNAAHVAARRRSPNQPVNATATARTDCVAYEAAGYRFRSSERPRVDCGGGRVPPWREQRASLSSVGTHRTRGAGTRGTLVPRRTAFPGGVVVPGAAAQKPIAREKHRRKRGYWQLGSPKRAMRGLARGGQSTPFSPPRGVRLGVETAMRLTRASSERRRPRPRLDHGMATRGSRPLQRRSNVQTASASIRSATTSAIASGGLSARWRALRTAASSAIEAVTGTVAHPSTKFLAAARAAPPTREGPTRISARVVAATTSSSSVVAARAARAAP